MEKPKYVKIKDFILGKIKSGEWQEHTQVPSENELSSRFTVSRMTARRALTDLVDAGILTRSQGLGTFVANFKNQSSLLEIGNISDEIKNRGQQYMCNPVILERIQADPPVAIALGVDVYSDVFRTVLVHFENDTPIQAEERYVNPELAPQFLQQNFEQTSPHDYLLEVAPLTQDRHTVEAISPDEEICEWLRLYNEEPCLQILRRTGSKDGVVSFARLISPGNRYKLGGHLTIRKSA